MSEEKQQAVYDKVRAFYKMPNLQHKNKDNKPKEPTVKFGPNTTRKVTNASVVEDSDNEKEDTDDEEPPPGTIRAKINSIMSGARSQNVVRCVTASSSYDNLLLIDGGADTCMMGQDFFIESRSSRTVTVEGFGGTDTTIRNMTLGNGITKVTMVGKDPFLMRVNDGIISSHKSILSSNQLWHYGCKVDDTPCKYSGRQCIWLPDSTYVPLQYTTALCYMSCTLPTAEDLSNLRVIDITANDGSWNP